MAKIEEDAWKDSTWNRIFSAPYVRSYAVAAIKLYDTLVELEDEGYETAVYPSRGTTPFKDLMWPVHTSGLVAQRGESDLHHRINMPFACSTIDLPFTADPPAAIPDGSAQIRDFWVRVLKALLVHDSRSPELRYYQYCLANIFSFEQQLGLPVRRSGSRFVFVDTVVSGKAVCEIATAFEVHGLSDFCFVLLIDEEGRKLHSDYRRKLEKLSEIGKAKLIYVKSLFTEDQGPTMTSTWCLSAPQLVSSANSVIDGEGTCRLVGTSVSFVRVSADPDLENMSSTVMGASLSQMVFLAMQEELALEAGMKQVYTRLLERSRQRLVRLAMVKEQDGFNPLSVDETKRIATRAIENGMSIAVNRTPIRLDVAEVHVSSSHVVRLFFSDDVVQRLLKDFERSQQPALLSLHEP